MKIVQTDEVPVAGRVPARGGTGHTSQLLFDSRVLNRDPKRPDNFFMQISYLKEGQFSSPRHRHDFEQIRYMIQGEADYPEGIMRDGTLGYFPEGARYGPQEKLVGTVVVLQFGGPSGAGYVDRAKLKAAIEEIKARGEGEFREGVYYRHEGVEGPATQDGNEAAFEYLRKRKMAYPRPQYLSPILIDTNAFPWTALDEIAGVEEKALGTFSSAKVQMARYKLNVGAKFAATGRGAYLVLSGAGRLDDEPFRRLTALYLEDGEEAIFTASETSDILALGLPSIERISKRPPESAELGCIDTQDSQSG